MDLHALDLYALPPEQFTAARDAQVKAARLDKDRGRARDLASLRRPTVSAYVVNALVRRAPELLERLLALGPQLAEAQAGGDAQRLRALGAQRRSLLTEVADGAQQAAGRALTAGVRDEVLATLESAVADPSCAAAARSGRLVRPLLYAGFGAVDLDGAVGAELTAPVAPTAPRPPASGEDPAVADAAEREQEQRRRAVEDAERQAHESAGRLDDAVHAHRLARRAAGRAAESVANAVRDERTAEAALAAARDGRAATERHLQLAAQEAAGHEDVVRRAQQEADRAHEALDALRRSGRAVHR